METLAPPLQTSSDPTVSTTATPTRIEQTPPRFRMSQHKVFALGVSLVIVGVVLSPIVENWQKRPKDNFPLSYYPMFTENRPEIQSCTYLVGFDAAGNRHLLPYKLARQGGGLNQVRRQLARLVKDGRADEVCRAVAGRVAKSKREPQIVAVQVVTGSYALNDYFTGKSTAPLREVVHAKCDLKEVRP